MSIGMLALVGVQTTMRLNSDLAKQRTEATRIASEEIESLRSFARMGANDIGVGNAYDSIANRTVENYVPPDNIGNTSYRVVRTVTDLAGSNGPDMTPGTNQKVVTVQVQWVDRAEREQTATLDSVIVGSAPTLSAMLVVPARESATSRRKGRHATIPDGAEPVVVDGKETGDSRFVPPGASGVAWYFNNLSGVMRVCNVDGESCVLATLVTGSVRYHLADDVTDPVLDAADAEHPKGPSRNLAPGSSAMELVSPVGAGTTASCFSRTLTAEELLAGPSVVYYCAVFPADTSGWGGQINPRPVEANGNLLALTGLATTYRTCRYTTDLPTAEIDETPSITEADPHAQYVRNADHPRHYCLERPRNPSEAGLACTGKRVTGNLINQNFLVIRGFRTCPTELNDDGSTNGQGLDPLVLANTRQHQPAP